MLSMLLRVELLVVALFFIVMVIRNVNKKKLLLQYSLVWLVLAIAMIIAALFPQIAVSLTAAGIAQPSNFVYAVGLFVLLFIAFNFTAKLSKQSSDIRNLTEQEAIDRFLLLRAAKSEEKATEDTGEKKSI